MLRFGFIGFGQYGGRQVDAILALQQSDSYVGMAVNTAVNDLEALTNVPEGYRLQLKGNSFGAGRTPELGLEAFMENGPEFVELAQKVTQNVDFIWAVAGLGGGTGTGALQGFLQHGTSLFDQPIGLIVTLPRDDDGPVQKANAMGVLSYIQQAVDEQRIGAVIIVDNDRFYKQFAEEKKPGDWRDHSNKLLAQTLHKINQISSSVGQSNFDRTDLLKVLSSSGCLAIGNAALHEFDQDSVYQVIRNSLNKGFFANGYRLAEGEIYAVCFTLNEQGAKIRQSSYEQHFVSHLKTLIPNATDSFFGYYSNGENHVLSLVSGLGLPDRVFTFKDQIPTQDARTVQKFEAPVVNPLTTNNPLLRKQRSAVSQENNPLLRRTAKNEVAATKMSDNPLLKRR
ncbi:hypothetical protein ACOALA_20595 (plasmid) [Alicyclobacillus acidoterrestris]|uniref:hypothetical protein n=1 Tax=Alicyclobacillus acidoterrestris TaxID=1450 RepID=UPI003F52D1B2